ncbi:MAG: hypothetical protein QME62_04525 [Armatimonadota bacterium]|nr:hypothetical protein [Armatimonadota bacterium]
MNMKKAAVIMSMMLVASGVWATVVTLPDTSQTTTFTATVSEQANVSVPASVTFTVNNVSENTSSTNQTVSATSIVLSDGKKLRIEIAPNAANFTPPSGGSVTWASSDISWNAPTWTGGTGNAASMSANVGTYTKVADMATANAGEVSTSALVFTLAAKATVDRAGNHTLEATWKFSSFTP